MRLIDADAMHIDFDRYVEHIRLMKKGRILKTEIAILLDCKGMIDNVPTVEAIPISFIRDKIEKIKTVISDIHGVQGFEDITRLLIHKAIYLERLIEEWEMENERKEE